MQGKYLHEIFSETPRTDRAGCDHKEATKPVVKSFKLCSSRKCLGQRSYNRISVDKSGTGNLSYANVFNDWLTRHFHLN